VLARPLVLTGGVLDGRAAPQELTARAETAQTPPHDLTGSKGRAYTRRFAFAIGGKLNPFIVV